MRSSLRAAALAANAAFVVASPTAVSEPCAQVSAILAAPSPSTDSNGNIVIDIDTAYACLKSVPVAKSADLQQLNGYKTLANFQSDLVYLKDPPPGFLYPGVDLMSSLDGIISNVQNDAYDSEYDVQFALWSLIVSGYDFHLTYNSDILQAFFWSRTEDLVSLATDPGSLPDVYVASDIYVLSGLNSSSYKPSPVVSINDTDVEQWLNQFAALEPWDHDPDANYNNIFYSVAVEGFASPNGRAFSGNAAVFYHFPGSVTTLKFANGTPLNVQSYATTSLDFTGVTDGTSFFQKFCIGPSTSASSSAVPSASGSIVPSRSVVPSASGSVAASASSSIVTTNNLYTAIATPSAIPALPFFPEPLVKASDNSISGFLPEDCPDLAVVTLPTFGPSVQDWTFQNVFRSLLATAKSLGKTKLIIDVRGNNGGDVELFPSAVPWGGSNMAAWPLFNAVGQVANGPSGKAFDVDVEVNTPLGEFVVSEDLQSPTGQPFSSWSDFYGPVQHHGGEFTNIKHYNFSSPLNKFETVYGYINDTKPQPQTFTSDNIVILSDGACGSTCAIFSELMKTQAGVQFITVGGRKQYGPTQPVGGSKGANDQALSDLGEVARNASQFADTQQQALFKPYAGLEPEAEQFFSRLGQNGANVNFQNNIRKGDDSVTPLQFVYEASNCRFFYTPQMFVDQSLVWSYTYNLQWGNGTCLQGSTGAPSAATGYSTSYINSAPPANAKNFFGANITWSYPGAYSPGEHHSVSPSSSASAGSGPSSTGTPTPPTATSGAAASYSTPSMFDKTGGVLGMIVASVLLASASVFLM